MEHAISATLSRYGHSVKQWWMLMLLGIVIFIIGAMMFGFPGASYIALALIFGLLILLSGIVHIIFALSGPWHGGKWWMLVGGIIELLLGVTLSLFPVISTTTLPIFLGFWLLFRAFSLLGMAGDMQSSKVPGTGWTIFTSILLMLCAFAILFHPILFGVEAVIIWVGISFLLAGISTISFSMQLRKLHQHLHNRQ